MPAGQAQTRRLVLLLILVFATVFILNRSARQCATQLSPVAAPEERLGPCLVTRVVDGNTIHVNCTGMRDKVRLLRIDTPEWGEDGYDEATEALAEMIAGEKVFLEFEVPGELDRGRYGRLLAYVFLLGDLHVNVEMVRQGWSPFWTKYGEGRYAGAFKEAEQGAREGGRGVWWSQGVLDPAVLRARMVDEQIQGRGIADERVLAAMKKVPRHEFVPSRWRDRAYEDHPLPIGEDQTITQPYLVGLMTELAALTPESRVLEVGTGSGYQAAVLAEIAKEVFTIEIIETLATQAKHTLKRLGYESVRVRHGDGYRGWPEAAPFGAILVTAAASEVPPPLLEQLAEGGRLVIPIGGGMQQLQVHSRTVAGFEVETVAPVAFVPMTGEVREGTR